MTDEIKQTGNFVSTRFIKFLLLNPLRLYRQKFRGFYISVILSPFFTWHGY
jgi:hypothetical protein